MHVSEKYQKEHLLVLARSWDERLKKCRYAGEIYLSQDDFQQLVREFRACRLVLRENKLYDTVVLVLAVNCAYHYYDDTGFWCHFIMYTGIDDTQLERQRIGKLIERKLVSLGLLETPRSGPFRFVGSILEQCGVSWMHIAPFGQIIKSLKDQLGWEALLAMSEVEFQLRLGGFICSRYLKKFLMEEAGWRFTMDVCYLTMLYARGALTVEELSEIPGYQPGFWPEFLTCFETDQRDEDSARKPILKPRLVFLIQERCVALQLPAPDYVSGIKYPAVKSGWEYPLTRLIRGELWSEQYSGYVLREGFYYGWQITGWIPDGKPVLFDLKKGLLERQSAIAPGEYILLACDDCDFPIDRIRHLGDVSFPGVWNYSAYLVRLDDTVSVPGYNLHVQAEQDITLKWIEPDKYLLQYVDTTFPDVFIGTLPEIYISDLSAIKENRTGVFCDIGSGILRLRSLEDLQRFRNMVQHMAPIVGRIWISDIARSGQSRRVIDELVFIIFPSFIISFENRLYGCTEEPLVAIEGSSNCFLSLPDCRGADSSGRVVAIPWELSTIKGSVVCSEISVPINLTVYRASICFMDGMPVRYITISELKMQDQLEVTGYPDCDASIRISGNNPFSLSVICNHEGRAVLNSEQLVGLANACDQPVCEVLVSCDGHVVSTEMFIINLDLLQQKICQGEGLDVSAFSTTNLTKIISLLSDIVARPGTGFELDIASLPSFSPAVDEWICTMFACTCVFDQSKILVEGKRIDWIAKCREPVRSVLNCYRNRNSSLGDMGDRVDVSCIPPIKRWKKTIENITRGHPVRGGIDILNEWSMDVYRGRGPCRSQIGRQVGGSALCRAWRSYLRKDYDRSSRILTNIGNCAAIVNDLKNLLQALLLLRQNRFSFAARELPQYHIGSPDVSDVFDVLKCAATYGRDSCDLISAIDFSITRFPFARNDVIYLQQIASFSSIREQVVQYCFYCEDWLLIWTVINILDPGRSRKLLCDRLLELKETIPESPERNMELKFLYKYSREEY